MPRRPAGTPGGAASTGVGPQSCAPTLSCSGRSDLGSSRRPRPLPPSRVNGSWLRTGPRHLLSSAHSRRSFDRALRDVSRSRSRVPATRSTCPLVLLRPRFPYDEPRPFRGRAPASCEESFCRVIDPRSTARAPSLPCFVPATSRYGLAVLPARPGHVRRCGGSVTEAAAGRQPSRSGRPAPAREPPVSRQPASHR